VRRLGKDLLLPQHTLCDGPGFSTMMVARNHKSLTTMWDGQSGTPRLPHMDSLLPIS
jgi:hypothetical protein